MSFGKRETLAVLLLLAVVSVAASSYATPTYSGRVSKSCKTCHLKPGGGALNETGLSFAASGYVWPPTGGYRVLGPIRKPVRLVIGLMHIVAAFLWFGTILYVHILLKPAYAEKGLPRGEVSLGIVCMGIVGATGILLTVSRIKSIDVLYESPWGMVLSIKILFYLVMVCSAIAMVVFVGPRLKAVQKTAAVPEDGVFDPLTLSAFDGREGRAAYIAYQDKVYDVTGLKLWEGGSHMKHGAGADLTDFLPKAPHGGEKLEPLKVVGSYDPGLKPPKTVHQKIFYVVAYMNLAIVFLVLTTIAVWRWGI